MFIPTATTADEILNESCFVVVLKHREDDTDRMLGRDSSGRYKYLETSLTCRLSQQTLFEFRALIRRVE